MCVMVGLYLKRSKRIVIHTLNLGASLLGRDQILIEQQGVFKKKRSISTLWHYLQKSTMLGSS